MKVFYKNKITINFTIFLLFLAALMPMVHAQIPSTLGWHQIPNTKIRSVCPPDTSSYDYTFYCGGVVGAWSGGVADTFRNRMIIWGGGHGDYRGNEVYELDLDTLTMKRLNNPSPNSDSYSVFPAADDGAANSRHTYGGLAYIANADKMYVFGGALWRGGQTASDTWTLDLANLQWQRMDPAGGTSPTDHYNSQADYDPNTKKVFVHDRKALYSYDYGSNQYTVLRSDHSFPLESSSVIDPKRKLFLTFGGGFFSAISIAPGSNYAQQSWSLSGCSGVTSSTGFEGSGPGLAYDPVQDRIVSWIGGNDVYLFNPDTRSCTTVTYSGGPGPATSLGMFGRFRFFPNPNVFAVVTSADKDAYVLRLTQGTVTPPTDTTPPTVSVSHSPTSNIQTSTQVTITATASDNVGVTSIEIFVDGLSKKICTSSPCTHISTYSAGTHNYYAAAKDAANNAGRDPASGTKSFSVSTPQTTCTNTAGFASNCVNSTPVLLLTNPSVSGSTLTVTANVAQSGTNAIYATGYYWSASQNQWIPFTLTGTAYPGTDGSTWLTNTASKSLSVPTSAAISGVIYVVTWDYTFSSNNWIGPACSNVAGCWRLATHQV